MQQDPRHILLACPRLHDLREEMWQNIGKRVTDMRALLDGKDTAKYAALMALKAGPGCRQPSSSEGSMQQRKPGISWET